MLSENDLTYLMDIMRSKIKNADADLVEIRRINSIHADLHHMRELFRKSIAALKLANNQTVAEYQASKGGK